MKLVITVDGEQSTEFSSEAMNDLITTGRNADKLPYSLTINEYILDETGNVCGIRGTADLGHGYGFDYGTEAFSLKVGEEYRYTHSYTCINGPSDWDEEDIHYTLQLVEENDGFPSD